eukprot:Sdes_comp18232_c0_seq1m7825
MFSRIFSPVAFRRITQPFISQSYASEAAASTSSSSSHVKLTFTAPGQAFYKNSPVDQINVPSTAGDFGILPSHVPSIAILRPGLVSVLTSGSLKSYFVSSGSVVVNADSTVQIIAEEACPVENLDLASAQSGLSECQSKLASSASEVDKISAEIGIQVYQAVIHSLASK